MSNKTKFPKYAEGAVYKNDGSAHSERYAYLMPADYAEGCYIGDCWECDANGNINPGYSHSPVPHHASDLGARQ